MGNSSRSSGDGVRLLPQQRGDLNGSLLGLLQELLALHGHEAGATVRTPWLPQASPYAQFLLLQRHVTDACLCPALCWGGGSFFYCSTAPEALLFQVGCDCCFCWSGLSFWTGTENEETGMKCIDFLKHIYNVFQYTLIKDTTSEDHGLLFIPFTRLRTYCTLCNKDSDQSSCFCCNSSKLIGFITWSTGRVWNMLWGNKGSGNTFINMLTTSLECFCFPIISYCSKMCLLHCYHRNACAYLEYLIMIFHTKTFRSLKGKKLSLIQNNLASSRPFSCSQSGCSASVLQVHSCWPWI